MAVSLTSFSNGTVLDSSGTDSPEDRIDDVEDYVNFGVGTGDLASGRIVKAEHIFRPEFRGSPDPHARLETGEVHWRYTGDDFGDTTFFHGDKITYERDDTNPSVSSWRWIKGMAATVWIQPNQSNNVCRGEIEARCFAYDWGGQHGIYTAGTGSTQGPIETSDVLVAQVGLFVNNSLQTGTIRSLYSSGEHDPGTSHEAFQFTKREMNWSVQFENTFSPGIYNIGFRIRIRSNNYRSITPGLKHISIGSRNLVFEAWYR